MKRIGYRNLALNNALPLLLMLSMAVLSGCALTIEESRIRADHNYKQGRCDEAIGYANSVIKQNPSDASAWKMLGMCQIKKGQFEEAVLSLKKATELKSTKTETDKALLDACSGYELFKQGHIAGAAEKFKSAEPFQDHLLDQEGGVETFYAFLYTAYGNVLEKTGQIEIALEMYSKALGLGRAEVAGQIASLERRVKMEEYVREAGEAEINGHLRGALKHYMSAVAVSVEPGDSKSIDFSMLEKCIQLYLRLDPKPVVHAKARRQAIFASTAVKEARDDTGYDNAIAMYLKAISLAPWWADLYINTALLMEERRYYKEAQRMLELYLLQAANAPGIQEVQTKIHELEYKLEELKKPPKGMVFIKGGCFKMGDIFGDGDPDERPVHEVCVDDFYLAPTEVTQNEWIEIMGENPSAFMDCGSHCPVENVSWKDIQEFVRRLNEKTGRVYRLPSEAEWEYAARSGGRREKWPGTNSIYELERYAWFGMKTAYIGTRAVGSMKPNGLGLYDMAGNVGEYVADWYDKDYYKKSPRDNPKGPANGGDRMIRGGSFGELGQEGLRTFRRVKISPDSQYGWAGLRLGHSVY